MATDDAAAISIIEKRGIIPSQIGSAPRRLLMLEMHGFPLPDKGVVIWGRMRRFATPE
jgi:hypothetical protein